MKKFFLTALLSVFFLVTSATAVFGQNKAGINIGDHWGEFDQAATIVGAGGWVVVMGCPGDGDKIAEIVSKHREINLIIRGHYPGNTPNASLARAWAATLGAIPTANKIYFMPWNEPNQEGSADYASPAVVAQYIQDLTIALAPIRGGKILLLSPMINISHPNYDNYVKQFGNDFFSQFDGIAMNLYDSSDGTSTDPHINPIYANGLLAGIGAANIPIFGVESGTSGNNFYFNSPPDGNSPLYRFVQGALGGLRAKMFALPSYDLAGERGHTWSLYGPPENVINLLRGSTKGSTTPASSATIPNNGLTKCLGKNYTFFETSEAECAECGGGGFLLLSCLPVQGKQFGEEYSKNTLKTSELVRNTYNDSCNISKFTAQITVSDMTIPFAYELNQYFLGPYADNLGARVGKLNLNPVTDFGVFEKLANKDYQDQLRLQFLDDIVSLGGRSKYANFKINNMGPAEIAGKFRNSPDKSFLTIVWPQVPLFANEETEGEIVLEGPGIAGSVKTSVPEVYRLNKVTTELAKMMGVYQGEVQGIQTESGKVLAACDTGPNNPIISNKETKTGAGSNVCTKDEIQTNPETNLSGERSYDKEVFQPGDAGGCDGKTFNSCCGSGGKCEPVYTNDPTNICIGNSCTCKPCSPSWVTCSANGTNWPGCQIREAEHKFDIDISVKNRVPFLKQIAENTVGLNGFFRTFISASDNPNPPSEEQFKEVAGESTANVELNNIKVTNGLIDVQPISGTIRLLFHKLGTLINVKNFISGVVLRPFGSGNTFVPPSDNPPINAKNLADLFNQVGNAYGVPPKVLEAVMWIEGPQVFSYSEAEIQAYSQPGGQDPINCTANVCSAVGPMQITTGKDASGDPTCSNCCGQNHGCLSSCPNVWSGLGCSGDPCNIADSLKCAAGKLRADSGATSMPWTEAQVRDAAYHYYGCCDPVACTYARLGGTYCDFVWNYYNQ